MGNHISEPVGVVVDGSTVAVDISNVLQIYQSEFHNPKTRAICLGFIEQNFLKIVRLDQTDDEEDSFAYWLDESDSDSETSGSSKAITEEKQAKIDKYKTILDENKELWGKLSQNALIEILKSDRLAITDEFELFLLLKEWAVYRIKQHMSYFRKKHKKKYKGKEKEDAYEAPIELRGADALYENMKQGVHKMLEESSTSLSPRPLSTTLPSDDSEGEDSLQSDDIDSDFKKIKTSDNKKRKKLADLIIKYNYDPENLNLNEEFKFFALKLEMRPFMKYIRFPMMASDALEDFFLAPTLLSGFIPQKYLHEAIKHYALTIMSTNPEDSNKGWYVCDKTNNRFRPRNYHTRFLWDLNWKGQHITIEENGHLARKKQSGWFSIAFGDTGFKSGVHYWEIKVGSKDCHVGISLKSTQGMDNYLGAQQHSWSYVCTGHKKNETFVVYGSPFAKGDKIGVRLDIPRKKLSFYKNGIYQGVAFTNLPSNAKFFPAVGFRDGYNIILRGYHGDAHNED